MEDQSVFFIQKSSLVLLTGLKGKEGIPWSYELVKLFKMHLSQLLSWYMTCDIFPHYSIWLDCLRQSVSVRQLLKKGLGISVNKPLVEASGNLRVTVCSITDLLWAAGLVTCCRTDIASFICLKVEYMVPEWALLVWFSMRREWETASKRNYLYSRNACIMGLNWNLKMPVLFSLK